MVINKLQGNVTNTIVSIADHNVNLLVILESMKPSLPTTATEILYPRIFYPVA